MSPCVKAVLQYADKDESLREGYEVAVWTVDGREHEGTAKMVGDWLVLNGAVGEVFINPANITSLALTSLEDAATERKLRRPT